jgi:hypothetical protein
MAACLGDVISLCWCVKLSEGRLNSSITWQQFHHTRTYTLFLRLIRYLLQNIWINFKISAGKPEGLRQLATGIDGRIMSRVDLWKIQHEGVCWTELVQWWDHNLNHEHLKKALLPQS